MGVAFILLSETALAHEIETTGAVFEKVTLSIDGPEVDERGDLNPFSDIRLDWIISKGDEKWTVPGYFAACGTAADNGCTSGNQWHPKKKANISGTSGSERAPI